MPQKQIAYLITTPLDADAVGHKVHEGIGTFTLPITVDEAYFDASGDKRGLFITTIAIHLASAIKDTEVPSHLWILRPSLECQRELNLPEAIKMGLPL